MPAPLDPNRRSRVAMPDRSTGRDGEAFSTTLFTGVNLAVFLVLAASVAVAGYLYSQGA